MTTESLNHALSGVDLIGVERERQVNAEGWTTAHDDKHTKGELSLAAVSYALGATRGFWPWDRAWWKPSPDPIRNLVKSGALIAAEIDRLVRLKTPVAEPDLRDCLMTTRYPGLVVERHARLRYEDGEPVEELPAEPPTQVVERILRRVRSEHGDPAFVSPDNPALGAVLFSIDVALAALSRERKQPMSSEIICINCREPAATGGGYEIGNGDESVAGPFCLSCFDAIQSMCAG